MNFPIALFNRPNPNKFIGGSISFHGCVFNADHRRIDFRIHGKRSLLFHVCGVH